jgi:hypothetical protein
MSTTNGYYSIQGYQIETPSGGRINLGPFNVPMSAVSEVLQFALTAGTQTIAVPTGTFGVAVIPPIGAPPAGVTLKLKTNSGDSGDFISTAYPSILEFDHVNNHVPANVYLVSSGNITVGVQFL